MNCLIFRLGKGTNVTVFKLLMHFPFSGTVLRMLPVTDRSCSPLFVVFMLDLVNKNCALSVQWVVCFPSIHTASSAAVLECSDGASWCRSGILLQEKRRRGGGAGRET